MQVTTNQACFYKGTYREAGEEFNFTGKKLPRHMEAVDGKQKVKKKVKEEDLPDTLSAMAKQMGGQAKE